MSKSDFNSKIILESFYSNKIPLSLSKFFKG